MISNVALILKIKILTGELLASDFKMQNTLVGNIFNKNY
jgi:hypothetical protein